MIGRLNHVAIAVRDLNAAVATYKNALGAKVTAPTPQPEHGVTVVFVELPNTKIELLHPLGDASPIRRFLDSNTAGGIHHLCYEVSDIRAARDRLRQAGARVLGDGEPKTGAHGKPDGFQVGPDKRANARGAVYHYIAWKAAPGKIAVGSWFSNLLGMLGSPVPFTIAPAAMVTGEPAVFIAATWMALAMPRPRPGTLWALFSCQCAAAAACRMHSVRPELFMSQP